MVKASKCHHDLTTIGYLKDFFQLNEQLPTWVEQENWPAVDSYFQQLVQKDGELFQYLLKFQQFSSIEFIISVRDASNDWEEDGIWHDDGSRLLAFSISLVDNQGIQGGNLLFRKKGNPQCFKLAPWDCGEIVVFKTGVSGFEHKVEKVTSGRRVVVAGWCS